MSIKKPENLPETPGIYFFKRAREILYIGKAANLKKRLVSYFRKNVSLKIRRLIVEATELDWLETESDIDALLKEAELVKKYRPKYNVLLRDDKNYFYVGITRQEFPKIFITHQPEPESRKLKTMIIGPFTSGSALKNVLKLLRKVFPYCTCKEPHKRPCLNFQIGRCPGFCCQRSNSALKNLKLHGQYQKNIKNVAAVLKGRKKEIIQTLRRDMKNAARTHDFELASRLRDQFLGLENIFAHPAIASDLPKRDFGWEKVKKNVEAIFGKSPTRVEGYDISNISGTEATGSMVVFVEGRPSKKEYRKFKIKTVAGANDIAMLEEVLKRRMRHTEWIYPELMLIDGGKAQLNAASRALGDSQFSTGVFQKPKIASLAKRFEELYIEGKEIPLRLAALPPETAFFFQKVRDESHRFAKKYHHKLREILYRGRKT